MHKTVPFLLIVLLTVAIPFPLFKVDTSFISISAHDVLAMLIAFLSILNILRRRKVYAVQLGLHKKITIFCFVFSAWSIFSLFAVWDFVAGLQALLLLIWSMVVYYLIVFNVRTSRQVVQLLLVSVVVCLAQSLYVLLQWLIDYGPTYFWGVPGTMYNSNSLGSYLAMHVPIIIGLASYAKKRRLRVLCTTSLVVVLAALVASFSRGAWLATAVASIPWVVRSNSRRSLVLLGVLAAIALVITTIALPEHIIFALRRSVDIQLSTITDMQYSSNADRLRFWKVGLDMALDSPILGVGIGNYRVVFPSYKYWGGGLQNPSAHSNYVQILAETGFVGLGIYLWFIATLVRHTWFLIRSNRGRRSSSLQSGLALSLATFLLAGVVDHNLFVLRNAIGFWMTLGLFVAYCATDGKECFVEDEF